MSNTYQRHHTVVAGVDLYFGLEAIGVTTHDADIYNHFVAKFHELEQEWVAELEEYAVINEICKWARALEKRVVDDCALEALGKCLDRYTR